jgi:hypothetical protein
MFRLVRFLISLALFAAIVWFATTIPLGKRTLWGHLRAIFATQEAKDLAEGTKEEAKKVADRFRAGLAKDGGAPPERKGAEKRPLDPLDEKERGDLDKLVKQKTKNR